MNGQNSRGCCSTRLAPRWISIYTILLLMACSRPHVLVHAQNDDDPWISSSDFQLYLVNVSMELDMVGVTSLESILEDQLRAQDALTPPLIGWNVDLVNMTWGQGILNTTNLPVWTAVLSVQALSTANPSPSTFDLDTTIVQVLSRPSLKRILLDRIRVSGHVALRFVSDILIAARVQPTADTPENNAESSSSGGRRSLTWLDIGLIVGSAVIFLSIVWVFYLFQKDKLFLEGRYSQLLDSFKMQEKEKGTTIVGAGAVGSSPSTLQSQWDAEAVTPIASNSKIVLQISNDDDDIDAFSLPLDDSPGSDLASEMQGSGPSGVLSQASTMIDDDRSERINVQLDSFFAKIPVSKTKAPIQQEKSNNTADRYLHMVASNSLTTEALVTTHPESSYQDTTTAERYLRMVTSASLTTDEDSHSAARRLAFDVAESREYSNEEFEDVWFQVNASPRQQEEEDFPSRFGLETTPQPQQYTVMPSSPPGTTRNSMARWLRSVQVVPTTTDAIVSDCSSRERSEVGSYTSRISDDAASLEHSLARSGVGG